MKSRTRMKNYTK